MRGILILIFLSSISFAQITDTILPVAFDENNNIDWAYTSILAGYNILNITDLFLTRAAIDKGFKEANPLMKGIVQNRPLDLIFKCSVCLAVNYLLKEINFQNKFASWVFAAVLNTIYWGIVIHNYQYMNSRR